MVKKKNFLFSGETTKRDFFKEFGFDLGCISEKHMKLEETVKGFYLGDVSSSSTRILLNEWVYVESGTYKLSTGGRKVYNKIGKDSYQNTKVNL